MANDTIITVENLGKMYRIRHDRQSGERYTALRDVIAQKAAAPFWWLRKKRQQDGPAGRWAQGPVVDGQLSGSPRTEEFWALRNINFEVRRGEVLGIIGRNGAGKSTLLKILSRITEPTEGRIRIRGRVASLLEVGTGFHPELTGRENIFLNGAVLGMTRAEIKAKFDEIVSFAEVEKFLDTPVKHYSSGMYVRLAFAVAAHLEPEILIIDEVLAVGDAEFQKKCLGKMQDVARGGRTVLFVSHNMGAVKMLCSRSICLVSGRLFSEGNANEVVAEYLRNMSDVSNTLRIVSKQQDVVVEEVSMVSGQAGFLATVAKPNAIHFRVKYRLEDDIKGLRVGYTLRDSSGQMINGSANVRPDSSTVVKKGDYKTECQLPTEPLSPGEYCLSLAFDRPPYTEQILQIPDALFIHLEGEFNTIEIGAVQLNPRWTTNVS
jgi:lipopolysaccharide transport system ATP-binding protein